MKRSSALLSLALLTACGDDDAMMTADAGGAQSVSVAFSAQVGTEDFSCGGTYAGVGLGSGTITLRDLRFYVHNVRLVRDDSVEVPLQLDETSPFQANGVALLDFEAGGAGTGCGGGTPETHTTLTGTVPAGSYQGLRFLVGVPFDQNHQDAAVAAPPLNSTSMFWNWNGGYKFIRIDGESDGGDGEPRLHLGSTGCDGDPASGGVTQCTNANRPDVDLPGVRPEGSTVTFDLAELFADSDLDTNTEDTPPGCMGAPIDPECGPIFAKLGLPFGAAAAGAQSVFSVD